MRSEAQAIVKERTDYLEDSRHFRILRARCKPEGRLAFIREGDSLPPQLLQVVHRNEAVSAHAAAEGLHVCKKEEQGII